MKFKYKIFLIMIFTNKLQSQAKSIAIEKALTITKKNINQLKNVSQLLVVFNENPESYIAVFCGFGKK